MEKQESYIYIKEKMKEEISQAFWKMQKLKKHKKKKFNAKKFLYEFNNLYCEKFAIKQTKLPRKLKKRYKKFDIFKYEIVLKPEFCIDSMMLEIEKGGE